MASRPGGQNKQEANVSSVGRLADVVVGSVTWIYLHVGREGDGGGGGGGGGEDTQIKKHVWLVLLFLSQ